MWVGVWRTITQKFRHDMNIARKSAGVTTSAQSHFDAPGEPRWQGLFVSRRLCVRFGGMRVKF